ncbi:MAG: hypothetical protein AAGJ80_19855, partial [Cyanobacteria bacterium J06553_1]
MNLALTKTAAQCAAASLLLWVGLSAIATQKATGQSTNLALGDLALGSDGYNWVGDFNGDGRDDLASALPDGTVVMRFSTGQQFEQVNWS